VRPSFSSVRFHLVDGPFQDLTHASDIFRFGAPLEGLIERQLCES
jgi:hypothetical protein